MDFSEFCLIYFAFNDNVTQTDADIGNLGKMMYHLCGVSWIQPATSTELNGIMIMNLSFLNVMQKHDAVTGNLTEYMIRDKLL